MRRVGMPVGVPGLHEQARRIEFEKLAVMLDAIKAAGILSSSFRGNEIPLAAGTRVSLPENDLESFASAPLPGLIAIDDRLEDALGGAAISISVMTASWSGVMREEAVFVIWSLGPYLRSFFEGLAVDFSGTVLGGFFGVFGFNKSFQIAEAELPEAAVLPRAMNRSVRPTQVEECLVHARVFREFGMESCGHGASLPDGDRSIVFALGGDDFDTGADALDFGARMKTISSGEAASCVFGPVSNLPSRMELSIWRP